MYCVLYGLICNLVPFATDMIYGRHLGFQNYPILVFWQCNPVDLHPNLASTQQTFAKDVLSLLTTYEDMERGSSVVECRTRNQVSPGSNPSLLPFRRLGIFVLSIDAPCSLSCINEYLAIDSGGNVSDLALARNCCLARMLPGEAELVSE